MPRRRTNQRRRSYRSSIGEILRLPSVQVGILIVVALLVFLLASLGGEKASQSGSLPAFVSVDEAYQMYQDGTFLLDVRTPEEWNEYHVPDTTLILLDELTTRVNELPDDQPIVVVCRSGNRSQIGRDILLQAGFNATSMSGGLNEWRDSGYPIVSEP